MANLLANLYYHEPKKSRLAYFQDFALKFIEYARSLCKDETLLDIKLKGKVYALNATVIDQCLDVFWWAKFRKTKAAIKLHTLLNPHTSIPEYIFITEGSVHEVNTLDYLSFPQGCYLVMDKGYVDFARLRRLAQERINFIARAKENMRYKVIDHRIIDEEQGVICDQTVLLTGIETPEKYPERIRDSYILTRRKKVWPYF